MSNTACKYYTERTLGWMLNNKIIVFLSLLSFCLFVSTLAMAGQRNRLTTQLDECRNSLVSITEAPTEATTLETAEPGNETTPPTAETAPPTDETIPPTVETIPPTDEMIPPAAETIPPTTETEASSIETTTSDVTETVNSDEDNAGSNPSRFLKFLTGV